MNTITATWFICKVRYQKTDEDGLQKNVTESYLIDALSFTEAEERVIQELADYITSEYTVKDITLAPYREVCFSDVETDERWYKVKLQFISFDERSGKEKRTSFYYLVQAANLFRAVKNTEAVMSGTMLDYSICSVAETNILDVLKSES